MIFKRINNTTINCIITPEDMHQRGLGVDDLFDRKKEAMEFLRSVLNEAMEKVNFHPQGGLTSMQMSVLPDHSVSLTFSEQPGSAFATLIKDLQTKLGITLPEDFRQELMKLSDEERLQRLRDYAASLQTSPQPAEKSTGSLFTDLAASLAAEQPDKDGSTETAVSEERHSDEQYIFEFDTFRGVLDCADYLSRGAVYQEVGIPAELYTGESDHFYLVLIEPECRKSEFRKLVLSVNEFGRLITARPEFLAHIREHSQCILKENTIKTLSEL